MRRLTAFSVAVTFAALAATASRAEPAAGAGSSAHDQSVVFTTGGSVRGDAQDQAIAFRGIPFAAPPTGPGRWQPPVPAEPWPGVRDATQFGPDCPQPVRPGSKSHAPQSEDCLTLNVVTPELHGRKRPVLVSIHGGAFFVGSGRYLAEEGISPALQREVVLVAPNYRIGRLGFFAHPALRADDAHGPFANYWLMDQIAALEWVRDNIERFGGDPGNVTILGCSAGGSSVNSLVASPRSRGLFQKASVHSGGGFFNATRTLAVADEQGIDFARREGVDGTGKDAATRLRDLTVDQVLAGDPGPPNFGAVIDGNLLPKQISVSFAKGEFARVPLIVGSTSNEASVFGLMGFDRQVLHDRFGIDVDAVRAAYDVPKPLNDAELLRQIQTDFIFTSASMGMAQLVARAGSPAYAYYFEYVPPDEADKKPGADHCADMKYLFADPQKLSGSERTLAELLQAYLLNFMRTGDPNGGGSPAWPRTMPGEIDPLVIGSKVHAEPGFRQRQLQVWFDKWQTETGERLAVGH